MAFEELENQNVLVTGAASGIGNAICKAFASQKSNLILTDINLKNLEEVEREIKSYNISCKKYLMDVSSEESVKATVEKILQDFVNIDILVNNAGVSTMNFFWELREEEWNKNMNVNAKGPWLVSKYVVKNMMTMKKGKIINIASMAGKLGAPLLAHYSASKFAVIGLTQAMAKELAPFKINVNAVCPGYVKTPMQDREIIWEAQLRKIDDPEKVREEYIKMTPLGRLCYPEDVAGVVLFLSSKYSDYMTGQALNITGGACVH